MQVTVKAVVLIIVIFGLVFAGYYLFGRDKDIYDPTKDSCEGGSAYYLCP